MDVAEQRWAERRSSERVVLKTSVTLASESNFYTGFTNNISEGGIFIATYAASELGRQVEIEFSLPDEGPPIRVAGEVCWLREPNPASDAPPGLGLRFLELADEDRTRIEAFVRNRDTIFYD